MFNVQFRQFFKQQVAKSKVLQPQWEESVWVHLQALKLETQPARWEEGVKHFLGLP